MSVRRRHRGRQWQHGRYWFGISTGWHWRFLWRVEQDGTRFCLLGLLMEWGRYP